MKRTQQNGGFTLLEMSVVLVLIGLIVGGVLVGNDMLGAAKLNSIISEYQKYRAAVITFREKYDALPGDMADATSYWGTINGVAGQTCPSGYSATRKTLTCDGNGNDKIGGYFASTTDAEHNRAWQHLTNAGLLSVASTGINTIPSTYNPKITWGITYVGVNDEGSNIYIWPFVQYGSETGYFDYGHVFFLGAHRAMDMDHSGLLPTSIDIRLIDKKMDDGLPLTGSVRSMWRTHLASTGCGTLSTNAYAVSTEPECAAIFITGF